MTGDLTGRVDTWSADSGLCSYTSWVCGSDKRFLGLGNLLGDECPLFRSWAYVGGKVGSVLFSSVISATSVCTGLVGADPPGLGG